ncbi:hypothetical protein C0991_003350, partial [Blastosporella zonata]
MQLSSMPYPFWTGFLGPCRGGFARKLKANKRKQSTRSFTGKSSGMNTWATARRSAWLAEGICHRSHRNGALHTFILACMNHPECITAAQEELDNVVGPDRLLTFKDRLSSLIIEAVVG